MNKTPTAHEFAIQNGFPDEKFKNGPFYNLMIAFAKFHVKQALKAANNKAKLTYKLTWSDEHEAVIDKNSILNSYPETNIK